MSLQLSKFAKKISSVPLIAILMFFISACEMQTSSVGNGQMINLEEPIPVALLVPKTISSKLKNISNKAIEPFLKIFSTSDSSNTHPELRNKF